MTEAMQDSTSVDVSTYDAVEPLGPFEVTDVTPADFGYKTRVLGTDVSGGSDHVSTLELRAPIKKLEAIRAQIARSRS